MLVEPSPRRIFPDSAYAAVGAKITEDISAAPVIVGVKEVAMDQLLPEHTYMFFSHVIKAQVCDSRGAAVRTLARPQRVGPGRISLPCTLAPQLVIISAI